MADRFDAVFEAAGLGMILVGPDCLITGANASAEMLSGLMRSDMVDRLACSELLGSPEGFTTGCAGLCPRSCTTGPDEASTRAAVLYHASGREVPVRVSAAPLPGNQGHVLLLWDATERVKLEAETALHKRQAEGIMEIGRVIAAYPDLDRNKEQILERIADLFDMDLAAWGLLEEGLPRLTWHTACGAGGKHISGAVQSLDGLLMGRLLLAGRPFITQNLAGQSAAGERLFSDPPLQTAIAVPVRVHENVYGVLLAASTQAVDMTEVDVMFLSHLGRCIATATENAELMNRVRYMAALEERHRLAREMHDSFGQLLTYLGLRHHLIDRFAEAGDTRAIRDEVERLKTVVQEAHNEVRGAIFLLKESGPPRATMQDRWRQILRDFEERSGIHTAFEASEGVPARLPEHTELQLTRIVQEALTNVRNHSGALSVSVRLWSEERALLLQIADDGCGFEPGRVHGPSDHHFGLTIMQERAETMGAALEIRSKRGQGTTVSVRLPLGGEG